MPRLRQRESWENEFFDDVSDLAENLGLKGLSVKPQRGKIRLRYRPKGEKEQGETLEFDWSKREKADAYTRIRNIASLMSQGHQINNAALIAAGRAPNKKLDWGESLEKFKIEKTQFGNSIKEVTWRDNYMPPLTELVALMDGKSAPSDGNSLIEQLVIRYEPGCRTRTIRVDAVTSFLKFLVDRHHFPSIWIPTKQRKDFIGKAPAGARHKNKDIILTDDMCLALLQAIPDTASKICWKNVLKTMIVFGLRGIAEVRCLEIRYKATTKTPYVFCTYEKRSGNGATEPRTVRELAPVDGGGNQVDWRIFDQLVAGTLEFPNLENKYSFQTFLNREPAWRQLKADLANKGFALQGKKFRDLYSLRSHQIGISAESTAESMGHSLATHIAHYPWASEKKADDEYAAARKKRRTDPT